MQLNEQHKVNFCVQNEYLLSINVTSIYTIDRLYTN